MTSVQMYTLQDEKHQLLKLRHLQTRIPLQCKQAEPSLHSLQASATLQQAQGTSDAVVILDPELLIPQLKVGGTLLTLQQDAEWKRLQHYLLRCWINLLRAREKNLGIDHSNEILAARQGLKT